jgi:hypothetical protein
VLLSGLLRRDDDVGVEEDPSAGEDEPEGEAESAFKDDLGDDLGDDDLGDDDLGDDDDRVSDLLGAGGAGRRGGSLAELLRVAASALQESRAAGSPALVPEAGASSDGQALASEPRATCGQEPASAAPAVTGDDDGWRALRAALKTPSTGSWHTICEQLDRWPDAEERTRAVIPRCAEALRQWPPTLQRSPRAAWVRAWRAGESRELLELCAAPGGYLVEVWTGPAGIDLSTAVFSADAETGIAGAGSFLEASWSQWGQLWNFKVTLHVLAWGYAVETRVITRSMECALDGVARAEFARVGEAALEGRRVRVSWRGALTGLSQPAGGARATFEDVWVRDLEDREIFEPDMDEMDFG